MEQDEKIFDTNIDPFSQKWAQPLEEQNEPPLEETLNLHNMKTLSLNDVVSSSG